jgi:hypothetical protein
MVLDRGVFFLGHERRRQEDERQGGYMLQGLLKLVGGVVAIGAGVLGAVVGTGLAGDGLVETFGGPEVDKGNEGLLTRKAS